MTYSGNFRLGDLFASRRERGRAGLPTLSVTLNDGLVNREDLNRKQDTNLAPEEHLLVKPGDIVYNMMRMWQGASGMANGEGLVSPAYVVLKPKRNIDPLYASHLFKSTRMIYLFWAYSYGMTEDRLRLYFQDFQKVPVLVPPLANQQKIARVLTTWEKSIDESKALLSHKLILHKRLLKSLTTGHLRIGGFQLPWREFSLGQLGKTFGGLTGKTAASFGQGKPYIPYTNIFENSRIDIERFDYVDIGPKENQTSCKVGDIFFTASSETPDELGTTSVLLDDVGELYLNSFCIGFRPNDFAVILPEYARFLFRGPLLRRSLNRLAQGYTRFNLSKQALLKLRMSLPSISEQRAISELLSASEASVDALRKNVAYLEREKAALLSRLIDSTLPRAPMAKRLTKV